MALLKKAVHLIGPALFIFIFLRFIDLNILLKTFKTVSAKYLLLSLLFNTLFISGKIYRLHFLLNRSDIKVKFSYLSRIYSYSFLLGQMSNLLVADISSLGILFMEQKNKLRISNIFIISKIADFITILSIFFICLAINYHVLNVHIDFRKVASVLLIFVFVVIVLVYLLKSRFLVFAEDLLLAIRSLILPVIIFTSAIYIFYAATALSNATAFNVFIPLSFLLLVNTLGNLITVLPISVSGIGTRDLAFIFLMNFVNVSSEKALALSSIGYIVIPVFAICLIYIFSLVASKYEDCHNC